MTPLPTQDELRNLIGFTCNRHWTVENERRYSLDCNDCEYDKKRVAAIVFWALGIIGEDDVSGGNPGHTFKEQHRNELRAEQRAALKQRIEKENQ